MFRVSEVFRTGKPHSRNSKRQAIGADVPFAVRGPVYVAAACPFAVYAAGYLNAGLGAFAWGLVGVTAMAELLKPHGGAGH